MRDTSSNSCDHRDLHKIRLVQFDFLRATEMAALNCLRWIGTGDKESADAAACDAIRGMFDAIDIRGEIVIGEGIKDEAPGLFAGEQVGTWREGSPRVDIAIDPLDGTTNLSKGLPNSISCIAVAVRDDENVPALQFVPAFYMKKLAYPPAVRRAWIADNSLPLDINAPLSEVIAMTARLLEKDICDVVVMVMDRPRNAAIIDEVRSVGAQLRMIVDGDIAAALGPAIANSGVDLYAGIGGAPEGILAAAGLRCMGGGMQAQMWPRDEQERASLVECGWSNEVEKVYRSRDLVHGKDILFIATGISDSPLLRGVQTNGSKLITHSVLMRQRSGSIRFVNTEHDLGKRSLQLRSTSPTRSAQINRADTAPGKLQGNMITADRAVRDSETRQGRASKVSCVLLFGAPGSGKGTIGKALGALPGFNHCSSGDIIREVVRCETNTSDRWRQVSRGELISDDDLWELFDQYLERYVTDAHAGEESLLLIDGIPRNQNQVIELSNRITVRGVLYLDCGDQDALVQRLIQRFKEQRRTDDSNIDVIRDRIRLYYDQILPLLEAYPTDLILQCDATQRPDRVLSDALLQIVRFGAFRDGHALNSANNSPTVDECVRTEISSSA